MSSPGRTLVAVGLAMLKDHIDISRRRIVYLTTYRLAGVEHVGVVHQQRVYALPETGPRTMLDLIDAGQGELARASHSVDSQAGVDLAEIEVLPPIPRLRRNVFCVGKNYVDHGLEFQASGFDTANSHSRPKSPIVFIKATTSVIGHGADVAAYRDPTCTTDYEVAVVIGIGGSAIPAASALRHVFGYTIVNDVTARELQRRHGQWFLGKSLDTFCPMGPWIATAY
jgi:2-keto-4-pentenoate hydratase/2-oxohepta-3-ene-1,7-dioic acid hydratase in catechol pathway